MEMKPEYKRHEDDERIDEISFKLVPRYKTSGLSGDEWRVSTHVELKWKGAVIYERSYSTMEYAVKHLPWLLATLGSDEMHPDGVAQRAERDSLCHQPSCPEKAISVYRLKKEYCREGFERDTSERSWEVRRAFCKRHLQRGDCGLEDSDSNYELVSGPGPGEAEGWEGDESPSVLGGVVYMNAEAKD